jgi:hypothetical protein
MIANKPISNKLLSWGCALALFLAGAAGCTSKAKVQEPFQPTIHFEAEYRAWENGLRAFHEGDYAGAGNIFETLTQTAQTPEIRRRSLFAVAVVKLTLAQAPEEYAEAVSAWERWSSLAGSGLEGEDPRLITPFVLRLLSPAFQARNEPLLDQPRKVPKEKADNAINYRNMLQSKEKEVESLRSKLDSRDREVRRLRHQLESLEEIHRKYQEKKQEASSP